MNKFNKIISELDQSLKDLLSMNPISNLKDFPRPYKKKISGIYLFSECDQHLYVGRSRNIRKRYSNHSLPSSNHYSASFAFLLMKEKIKETHGCEELKKKREDLTNDHADLFSKEKKRVKGMQFRFVEEKCPVRQALLEIYCAVELDTDYNSFETH